MKVLVDPVAEVVLDSERHATGHESAGHAEREPKHAGARDGERERPEVRAALADLVNRAAHEVRDEDPDAHRRGREHERDEDTAAVRAKKAEQAPEGPHPPRYFT